MHKVLTICKYGLDVTGEQLLNATKYNTLSYTAASFMTTLSNDSIHGCQ